MNSFVIDHKGNPNAIEVMANCIRFIRALPKDKKWEIVIKPYRFKRSLAQNNYLWKVYELISENEGGFILTEQVDDVLSRTKANQKYYIHVYFKQKFLKIGEVDGVIMTKSTTELDTKQFTEYVEQIMMYAVNHLGYYVPKPFELGLSDYQKWWGK